MRYVISDIHGNARPFLKLLDYVDPDPEELVICGDLVDRGLDSWGVIEECSQLIKEGTRIVRGNHDNWCQLFYRNQLSRDYYASEMVGGLTTIKSFELAMKKHGKDAVDRKLDSVFMKMEDYVETDNYIFVHAAIDPRIPYMEDQKPNILREGCMEWRNPRLTHSFDQIVVFGHTPTYSIHKDIQEDDAKIWFTRNGRKMGIDTGAGFGARLTMADLQTGVAYAYDFAKRDIIEYQFKSPDRKVSRRYTKDGYEY